MRAGRLFALTLSMLFVLTCVWEVFPRRIAHRGHNDTRGWKTFYHTRLSQYVKVPPEAVIVDYQNNDHFWGTDIQATFSLPHSRTPQQWIRQIVLKSNMDGAPPYWPQNAATHTGWGTGSPSGLEFRGCCVDDWYVK